MFTRSLEIIWLLAGDGYRRPARRRCTDPFCAMVFVVFLFGMWCLAQGLCGLRMPSGSLWDSVAMDENRNCQESKKHPVRHTCKPDFNLWAAEILGSDAPGLSWPPKASLRSWGQSSTMPWEKGTWQSCPMAPVFSARWQLFGPGVYAMTWVPKLCIQCFLLKHSTSKRISYDIQSLKFILSWTLPSCRLRIFHKLRSGKSFALNLVWKLLLTSTNHS